jgi:hypothetical protein
MTRHWLVSLSTALLLVLSIASTVRLSAQATVEVQRFTEPFVFNELHPCSGEPVTLSGELRLTERVVSDSAGGVHLSFHLRPSQVRGTGAGQEFMAVGGSREHINELSGGLPFTDTFTTIFNLVSRGGGENFVSQATFHITVNENGDVTAEVDRVRSQCVG